MAAVRSLEEPLAVAAPIALPAPEGRLRAIGNIPIVPSAILGLVVALQSASLATDWQPLGDGAWGGTTDLGKEHTYRAAGLTILTIGLFFSSLCGYLWISEPSDPARTKEEG